jgi:ATP-dependent RNA helicase DDX49/DBP8
MASFERLGLAGFLLQSCRQVGLNAPTPVQAATIPEILAGRNVVAASPTGTGKTAAFALPIISKLSGDPFGIFCVVLGPTRELAGQIAEQLSLFGAKMRVAVAHIHGGAAFGSQGCAIEANPRVLVATPGRLLQHLRSATRFSLQYARFLVLDEVDRLFRDGFWRDVEQIIGFMPTSRQTLLFSATLGSDVPVSKVLTPHSSAPFFWNPSAEDAPRIQHVMMPVPAHVREVYLIVLLDEVMKSNDLAQVLVFTGHCETTEMITLILRTLKFKTAMLHSKMQQEDRFRALRDFKGGRQRILVATDLAARGLDIPLVDHVIHYNPPASATTYIHRAGRTGRAGRAGRSVLFINRESDAAIVEQIEKELGRQFEVHEIREGDTIGKMREVNGRKEGRAHGHVRGKFR